VTDVFSGGSVAWEHTDTRGPHGFYEAIERAKAGDWSGASIRSTGTPAQDWRALCVATIWAADMLSSVRPYEESGRVRLPDPQTVPYPFVPANMGAASTLLRPMMILAGPRPVAPARRFRTLDGLPPETLPGEAGFPILGAIAIVVGAGALAAAIGYVTYQAAQIVDRYLARREDTARMVAAQARAVEIVKAHAQSDQAQGAQTPLSSVEQGVMAELRRVEDEVLAKQEAPVGSGLPSFDSSKLVAAGVVLVGGWYLLTRPRARVQPG